MFWTVVLPGRADSTRLSFLSKSAPTIPPNRLFSGCRRCTFLASAEGCENNNNSSHVFSCAIERGSERVSFAHSLSLGGCAVWLRNRHLQSPEQVPGFARLLNRAVAAPLALGDWGRLYLGSDLLMLALGVYDLATRARLHPAYLAGVVWMIALQITALVLLGNPTWKALSLHLIGH